MIKVCRLRQQGIRSLDGKWSKAIGSTLLFILASLALAGIYAAIAKLLGYDIHSSKLDPLSVTYGFVGTIFKVMLMLGLTSLYLRFSRSEEAQVCQLFSYFKTKQLFKRGFIYSLLYTVYLFGWTLLFIIPGIIKIFSYAMAPFLLNDCPEYSANEAISRSREMMDGHKGKLFLLSLSFLGWYLLSLVTFGLGLLWFVPYFQSTLTQFYLSLRDKEEERRI